jgi:hypothetical protein
MYCLDEFRATALQTIVKRGDAGRSEGSSGPTRSCKVFAPRIDILPALSNGESTCECENDLGRIDIAIRKLADVSLQLVKQGERLELHTEQIAALNRAGGVNNRGRAGVIESLKWVVAAAAGAVAAMVFKR